MFTLRLRPLISKLPINSLKVSAKFCSEVSDKYFDEILYSDREYLNLTESYLSVKQAHNCFIIQPYVKWGPQKLKIITPEEQLDEAKALINTLPRWTVHTTTLVPLENFDQKKLFRSGTMERLNKEIKSSPSTAVFINLGTLKKSQIKNLEEVFHRPIFDRYKIVMQILKFHATSKHAKLQVALAELYYLQRNAATEIFLTKNKEKFKMMFQEREKKLKEGIVALRKQRSLLRNKRIKIDYPVVAVVGYTNAGKTSIIKALTGEDKLQPRDQLFATLDVTLHKGMLPSGMEVLYVDTVGFISDIPTNLIECFIATLEDAVLADLILHVEDVSSSCYEFKNQHVLKTLHNLGVQSMEKVLSVGNKCDLVEGTDFGDLHLVSSKLGTGLDSLRFQIEKEIIRLTNRHVLKIKLPAGGEELAWMYKNATVAAEEVDKSNEFIYATVVITNAKLQQFKHFYSIK